MKNPKFSIITPTHKPTYIQELYESIKNQTYKKWEWIIYLNGGVTINDLPSEITSNIKVKIYHDDPCDLSPNVGYQKNKAFHLGTGDILVEVDHDDILIETCLEELVKAYEDPDVGFVYSDDAILADNFTPFNPSGGWSWEWFNWKDKKLIAHHGFPPSAASVSMIYYAPDHVRSWRADIYHQIGGHNVNLSILDDQDLMIRTYMVTKFKHIPKVLYIYRVHSDNTWIERNESIQKGTWDMFNIWQQALAEREADLKGLRKIDIGGGLYPKPGYESVDIINGDITANLNDKWPFLDGEIGVINASHVIEHLNDKHHTMSEMYRVLADGGWAFIEVPSTDGRGAWQDPTHVSFWNQNSFWYYTRQQQMDFIYNKDIKFQARDLQTAYPNQFFAENNIYVTRAWLRAVKSSDRKQYPGELLFDL
jgi:glycosyltransferase involved in cell wall biosynthesis/predicted SAM-dependent methyltransferase